MMHALRGRLPEQETDEDRKLKGLQHDLKQLEGRPNKLYEAVETGTPPLDSTPQVRAQTLKVQRETLLLEMAGIRRRKTLPLEKLTRRRIQAFTHALRRLLLDREHGFGKAYLPLLVDEMRVTGNEASPLAPMCP